RQAPTAYGVPSREVIVRDYDASRFGPWDGYYDQWAPVTLYFYDGYYYDYPVVEYAQPILVYSYRNQFFFPPRDRRFEVWRRQYRVGVGDYRGFPGYGRNARGYHAMPRDARDDRQFQSAPRGGRDDWQSRPAPTDGRNGRQFQPGGRDGRQSQAGPQRPGNGRNVGQGGNRGTGRSRPRP
ncbi:MAG: hypothetical protein ACRELE_05725, partial [Gemmatimonadales bacterium]